MNLENLELKTYKNYKELCGILEEPIKGGKSKQLQMKDFERYFEFHKEGNKIVIDNIFSEEKEKIDMRKSDFISETDKRHNGNNSKKYKEYKQFKIKKDKYNNIGIYCITNGMDIYIGSTVSSFRNRFQEHLYGYIDYMKHTHDLLNNGGEFHLLYDMTNIKDETLIRMVENEYIQYFKEYTDFNVINHMNEANWKGKKTYKQKYKRIKIKLEDYDNALKVLEENGIEI